ncbi:hypothetical protein ACP70R_025259 [Stipagrostis hirtigluma subsp. patula]
MRSSGSSKFKMEAIHDLIVQTDQSEIPMELVGEQEAHEMEEGR